MVGKFVWHDLMTTDPDASRAFHTELFGWTTATMDMGPLGDYCMVSVGEATIGGIVHLEKEAGVPSHWIGYVAVDDVDAAGARAVSGGGELCVPGTDIPNIGRFSVITDPSGAVSSPYKGFGEADGEDAGGGDEVTAVGAFCWDELLTWNPEACQAFYGEAYGWTMAVEDVSSLGPYTVFKSGDKDVAGMMNMPEDAPGRSHWLAYVKVADVDAIAARIADLGGRVLVAPADIPGIGRFAVATDPTGAEFGVFCR